MTFINPWALGPWIIPALISLVTLIVGVIKLQRAESRLDAIRTNDVKHIMDRLDQMSTCLMAIEHRLDAHIQYHLTARREG